MYYIFELDFSQTDKEKVIVKAFSKQSAYDYLRAASNAMYIHSCGSTENLIETSPDTSVQDAYRNGFDNGFDNGFEEGYERGLDDL